MNATATQHTTLARANTYAATCIRCGARIPAGEGLLVRTATGGWAADHPTDCPEKPVTHAQPVRPAREKANRDGMYQTEDGTIYKVQIAVHGSGRLYAKRLNPDTGEFTYAAGAIHNLHADERMTAEQARAYGATYGRCCACQRTLTDEQSIARGYGPICARMFA